jgi:serine/threonine-protein kinase
MAPEPTPQDPAFGFSQSDEHLVSSSEFEVSSESNPSSEEVVCVQVRPAPQGDGPFDPLVGVTIGSYRVERRIGTGGMANIYLAEHTRIGRKVALKRLHKQYASDKQIIHRFFREARAVNQVKHPHIIEVTDFIDDDADNVCYIMEYLQGRTLEELLEAEGPLGPKRVCQICLEVASALQAVHEQGIVHRDLKPANIFLLADGPHPDFVKLLDFGVSKLMEKSALNSETLETQVGMIIGTPRYMAPEQARGREVDLRADVYAFGVILYEMLSGRNPFAGRSTIEVLGKHLNYHPEAPSVKSPSRHMVPPELDALAMRCLAKDAAQRPQNFGAVSEVLQAVLTRIEQEPEQLRRRPQTRPWRKVWRRRKTALMTGGLAAAGLGALGLVFFALFAGMQSEPAAAERTLASSTVGLGEEIEVRFATTPPGAEVFRAGEAQALGLTPFAMKFPRSADKVAFVFKLERHQSVTKEITLVQDAEIVTALAPATTTHVNRPAPKPKPKKPAKNYHRGATLDPFQ